jgi:hypothetical protein
VFVREHAFEHKDFFAAPMPVRVEKRLRGPAHQGGVLRLEGVQWQHFQILDHALTPFAAARVDDHALVVARINSATITVGELEDLLNDAPAPIRQTYLDPARRREYLDNLVMTFLLADESRRVRKSASSMTRRADSLSATLLPLLNIT